MKSEDLPPVHMAAIDTLEREFRRPLSAYFRRRLANPEDTEDLVQEVFLNLTRARGIGEVANVHAYVFSVATNLLRDSRRRALARRQGLHVDIVEMLEKARLDHGLIEEIEPERVLLGKEQLKLLCKALNELGTRTRDIFILCKIDHMRQQEAADHLGVSLSTIEKHLVKAVAHITMLLGGDDADR